MKRGRLPFVWREKTLGIFQPPAGPNTRPRARHWLLLGKGLFNQLIIPRSPVYCSLPISHLSYIGFKIKVAEGSSYCQLTCHSALQNRTALTSKLGLGYLILSSSLGFETLWSIDTRLAINLSVQIMARVSPKFPIDTIRLSPTFLTSTRQQVEPVSDAFKSATSRSILRQMVANSALILVFSFWYYSLKIYCVVWGTWGKCLAQYSETCAPPCPSRMAKSPAPSGVMLS